VNVLRKRSRNDLGTGKVRLQSQSKQQHQSKCRIVSGCVEMQLEQKLLRHQQRCRKNMAKMLVTMILQHGEKNSTMKCEIPSWF
jgi:hypothetical protein